MKIEINEEQKEEFLRVYKHDFETSLVSKGEVSSYYSGMCTGMEFVLTKLGIITPEEISKAQIEVKERLEDERSKPIIYE